MKQVVHEQTVWTLLKAFPEVSEDCDHLADLKRMGLNKGCQHLLQHFGM